MGKILYADTDRCFGCGICELACSFRHTGEFSRSRSRVSLFRWEKTCDAVPVFCLQCDDAPCMRVCGVSGAMTRDRDTGAVLIDSDRCIGCRLCMYACPYGAISYDAATRQVVKCDLCGGDPECARYCPVGAIAYDVPERAEEFLRTVAATRLRETSKGPAAALR